VRHLVGSSIIAKRKQQQANNSVWQFGVSINKELETGQIINDYIFVNFYFPISEHKIKQIIELYKKVGWFVSYQTDKISYVTFKFSLTEE